ncbi:uncharacterized protein RCC_09283 [Ramularia collo-cygni]|uniref:Chorismate mutase domain-containing protein n=1 Tax=Ramularia collo-cygni TaxID=112498 RepID=A0A2D3VJR9_9PEZI|nr:uncharacterized protein RCC_09283 [Ramularia collo-cygni]CZT23569.1 uncharacterized protein RCC_09283 [Ramularia collo-cygni]
MQYQPLLLAALAALTTAATTPPHLTLSYGAVSADLIILSNDIALTGPSSSSAAAYKKAYSDLQKFQIATGDTPNHPCPAVPISAVETKEQAEEYVVKTEEIAMAAFRGVLVGRAGTQICRAEQYLSAVGDYVKGSA